MYEVSWVPMSDECDCDDELLLINGLLFVIIIVRV